MATILVVDDDPLMLTSLADVISASGHRVIQASSALQAFDVAEKKKFDLIVADVRMEGIDGIDCIMQLVDRYPQIKSIVITGYASDDAPGRAMEADTCDYLVKPFETEQLLQAISRALGTPEESQGYLNLFSQLWGKARAAVDKVGVAVIGLEKSRAQAFQWYYLGIRSGHLGIAAAQSVWEILESAEILRLKGEREQSLLTDAKELKERYEQMGAFCKQPSLAQIPGKRKESPAKQIQFRPLFKNIRDGKISPEQLKLATYLQSLSDTELAASPQLAELKLLVWT